MLRQPTGDKSPSRHQTPRCPILGSHSAMFPLRLVVSLHPESPQVAHREPQVRTLGACLASTCLEASSCRVFFSRHRIEKRLLRQRGVNRRKPVASINSSSRLPTGRYKTVDSTQRIQPNHARNRVCRASSLVLTSDSYIGAGHAGQKYDWRKWGNNVISPDRIHRVKSRSPTMASPAIVRYRLLATVQGPPEVRFGLCKRSAKVG
jgi:hypothetical protein